MAELAHGLPNPQAVPPPAARPEPPAAPAAHAASRPSLGGAAPLAPAHTLGVLDWAAQAFYHSGMSSLWQRLDDGGSGADLDEGAHPPRVLTAAERERQRQFFVAEDEWQACPKWIFFPVNDGKQAWDFTVMVLVLYSVAVVPYRISFEEATGLLFWFEALLQLFFVADVLVAFNTAYLHGERWIVHRPKIAATYLKGWFWVDAPASIPTELIDRFVSGGQEGVYEVLPLLRALRLFRLLRLLKLLHLGDLVLRLEERFAVNLKGLQMISTVVLMLAFCHVLACVFYSVSIWSAPFSPKTWVATYDEGFLDDDETPVFDSYMIAFLWAIGLVCGQNSNVNAENMSERTLAIVVYLLAALFFAYIIAVVTDQLSAYVNDPTNKAMDELTTFIKFHKVPKDIEGRLKTYYASFLSTRSMTDEAKILGNLTPSLRDEVMDFLLQGTVRLCPLLHDPSLEEERLQHFQEAIYDAMKPVTYERQMLVVAKNHKSEDLYFLMRGQVNAASASAAHVGGGAADGKPSLEHTLFPIFEIGAFFGEQCLLDEANEVDYLAASRAELLCVPKDVFIRAVREHLDDEMRVVIAEAVWADIVRRAHHRRRARPRARTRPSPAPRLRVRAVAVPQLGRPA